MRFLIALPLVVGYVLAAAIIVACLASLPLIDLPSTAKPLKAPRRTGRPRRPRLPAGPEQQGTGASDREGVAGGRDTSPDRHPKADLEGTARGLYGRLGLLPASVSWVRLSDRCGVSSGHLVASPPGSPRKTRV